MVVLVVGLALQLGDDHFEALVHIVFLLQHFLIVRVQLLLVRLDLFEVSFQVFQASLGVGKCHLIFVVSECRLEQVITFLLGCLQWLLEFLLLLTEVSNDVIVVLDVGLDFLELLLVDLDQLDVFARDVVVVFLHLAEGVLVAKHELVDVLVLALLDFMHLDFHPEFQLVT